MADVEDRKKDYENIVDAFRGAIIFNRDASIIPEILTSDFVDQFAPSADPEGTKGVAYRFRQAQNALTTERVEVMTSICEGNVLSQTIKIHFVHTGEFMEIPPTNKKFWVGGSNTFIFRGRKISEHLGVFDVAKIPDLIAEGVTGGWQSMWEKA